MRFLIWNFMRPPLEMSRKQHIFLGAVVLLSRRTGGGGRVDPGILAELVDPGVELVVVPIVRRVGPHLTKCSQNPLSPRQRSGGSVSEK